MAEPVVIYDTSPTRRIPEIVRRIERKGKKVSKPLKRWGAYMMQETQKTFDQGGRGVRIWPPLSKATLERRKASGRGANPKRILQLTGHLRQSIKEVRKKVDGNESVIIFTKTPYAAVHQEGRSIEIPAHTIRPKKAKVLRFEIGGEVIFAKKVEMPARTVKVPKREFLFILEKDRRMGVDLLLEHEAEIANREIRR